MSDEQRGKNGEKLMAHGRNRSRERFVTVPQHRGCRARSPNAPFSFSDCSGNSPYNVEQCLQYPLPPEVCKGVCRERFVTVPKHRGCRARSLFFLFSSIFPTPHASRLAFA